MVVVDVSDRRLEMDLVSNTLPSSISVTFILVVFMPHVIFDISHPSNGRLRTLQATKYKRHYEGWQEKQG